MRSSEIIPILWQIHWAHFTVPFPYPVDTSFIPLRLNTLRLNTIANFAGQIWAFVLWLSRLRRWPPQLALASALTLAAGALHASLLVPSLVQPKNAVLTQVPAQPR